MVRILSEVEMNAVSIERCREYTQINSEVSCSISFFYICSKMINRHYTFTIRHRGTLRELGQLATGHNKERFISKTIRLVIAKASIPCFEA